MADVIFTTGKCPKSQMYPTIIDAFIAAGWTNVSSNPATDFDVLQSPGESGDKKLTIQLRPSSATNTNPTTTTDYNVISYRLVDSYTPGLGGTAGTFGRPASEAWVALYLVPLTTTIAMATELTYYMSVNKNRMILVIETPPAISVGPIAMYIGMPDATFASEPGSRGLLVAVSAYPKTNNSIHITNTPGEVAPEAASSSRTIYCQLAPKNPNSAGLYALSEMKYGSTAEGYRGKLNGIYALPAGNISNGDIINFGAKKYRAVVCASASGNSFPTLVLAIQIA